MYCKNCGSELPENAEFCMKCGFRRNIGDEFCPQCGKEVKKMQSVCLNCGFLLDDDMRSQKEAKEEDRNNDKDITCTEKVDADSMKKIIWLKLGAAVVAVLMVVAIVFLPMYSCYVDYKEIGMEDIEDLEELREVMQEGKIKKNFSLFDDIKQGIEEFFDRRSDNFPLDLIVFIFVYGVPMLEIAFVIVVISKRIPKISRQLTNYSKLNKNSSLKNKEITKMGINQKEGSWDVNVVIALAAADIFVLKIMQGTELYEYANRYLDSLAGVSPFMIITVILFIAYLVMKYMANGKINELFESVGEN